MIYLNDILVYLEENNVEYKTVKNGAESFESFCPINSLKDGGITWIRDVINFDFSILTGFNNLVIICNEFDCDCYDKKISFVFVQDPHSVFFSILTNFLLTDNIEKESIGKTSIIKTNKIGMNVSIGENCYICEEADIGDNVTILNNVSIECRTKIGRNTKVSSGVVIGTNGYGFYQNINGRSSRVPHLGGVIIGDNVEIGACTCIARGCLGDTVISDYVKIDNLCQIAHNVFIGKHSKIIAQSLLAGSSVIGENVWVAPCASVKNQVVVGDNALIGMGAVVITNVEPNKVVAGVPAKVLRDNIV